MLGGDKVGPVASIDRIWRLGCLVRWLVGRLAGWMAGCFTERNMDDGWLLLGGMEDLNNGGRTRSTLRRGRRINVPGHIPILFG